MKIINNACDDWIMLSSSYFRPEDILKRPFTGFLEEDLFIGFYARFIEDFQLGMMIYAKEGNSMLKEDSIDHCGFQEYLFIH